MTLFTIAARNLARNRFRAILTVLGVAVAIVSFLMLRTVVASWNVGVDYAATDRIGTRHSVSFVMDLPRRYADVIRQVDGVESSTFANWFGARDPRNPDDFFATLAVDPESYLEVYDEIQVDPAQRQAWIENRRGALVGDVLARRLHVQVGDQITLESPFTTEPTSTFEVSGIYTATRRSVDRSTFFLHWEFMNEAVGPGSRDRIGWIATRVSDASQAAAISQRIDERFAEEDTRTLSMSERAMNTSFMAMFSSVLGAIDIVSVLLLGILLMILGNTVAMSVRERTNEYGVLRALGFMPHHVILFIVGESVLLGTLAGIVGLALGYPLVEYGMGRFIEENFGSWFPYFRVSPSTVVFAMAFSVALGVVAAMIPALRASRLTAVEALRRID